MAIVDIENVKAKFEAGDSPRSSDYIDMIDTLAAMPDISGKQDTASAVSNAGGSTITASGATVKPLVLKGFASQTADLTQWQDSAGTVLASVIAGGSIRGFAGLYGANSANSSVNALFVTNSVAANVVAIIKGAASQTADLQQWQNSSGTVLAGISAFGRLNSTYKAAFSNSNFTTTPVVEITSTGTSATSQGLIVKGASGQTANLTEWQNSAGTILARVNQNGAIVTSAVAVFGAQTSIADTELSVYSTVATQKGIVIKGFASQSADLQQWQDSAATVLTKVNAYGRMTINSTADAGGAALYVFQPNGGYGVRVLGAGTSGAALWVDTVAGGVGQVIRGAASQTANLTEWQNSSGTAVAKIDAYGTFQNGTASGYGAWINVQPALASDKGIIVRGATSQTANLQEWQNSSASILAQVDAYGSASFGGNNTLGSSIGVGVGGNAAQKGITIRGAASQTADLQQWQNSAGTVLASINSSGSLSLSRSQYTSASLGVWASVNADPQGGSTGNALTLQTYNTTSKGIVIIGQASQTANLQEWQNSAGTVLASITSNGTLTTAYAASINNSQSGAVPLTVTTQYAATSSVLVVRGAASQTGNLQEWQNSAGYAGTAIDSGGSFYAPGIYASYLMQATSGGAAVVPMKVKGAASQTANLTEWQDSAGTVLARIRNDGVVVGPELRTTNNRVMAREESSGGTLTQQRATTTPTNPGTNLAKIYFRNGTNAGTLKLVVIAGTTGAETTILDNIPQ